MIISRGHSGQVLITGKYMMDYGLSMGKLILPDSIKAGRYQLIAFTNVLDRNNKPVVWFKSAIAIGNISNSNSLQQTVKTLETLSLEKIIPKHY